MWTEANMLVRIYSTYWQRMVFLNMEIPDTYCITTSVGWSPVWKYLGVQCHCQPLDISKSWLPLNPIQKASVSHFVKSHYGLNRYIPWRQPFFGHRTTVTKDFVSLISLHINLLHTAGQNLRHGAIVDVASFFWSLTQCSWGWMPFTLLLEMFGTVAYRANFLCLPPSSCLCLFTIANAAGPSQTRHEWKVGLVQSTPSSRSLPGIPLPSWPGTTPLLFHRSVRPPSTQSRLINCTLKDKCQKTNHLLHTQILQFSKGSYGIFVFMQISIYSQNCSSTTVVK